MKCKNCLSDKENREYCSMCGINLKTSKSSKNSFVTMMFEFRKAFKLLIVTGILGFAAVFASIFVEKYGDTFSILSDIFMDTTILIGAVTFIWGGIKVAKTKDFKTAKGKLIKGSNKDKNYLRIIEYDANHKKYRMISEIKMRPNEEILIKYDPKNPHTAIDTKTIDGLRVLKVVGIVMVGFVMIDIVLYFV